jgi:hypothetical protein
MEVSGQLHSLAALLPGKETLVPIGWEAGWASEPVWTRWWREKFPASARTRTPDHPGRGPALYHWAIPAPIASTVDVSTRLFGFWPTILLQKEFVMQNTLVLFVAWSNLEWLIVILKQQTYNGNSFCIDTPFQHGCVPRFGHARFLRFGRIWTFPLETSDLFCGPYWNVLVSSRLQFCPKCQIFSKPFYKIWTNFRSFSVFLKRTEHSFCNSPWIQIILLRGYLQVVRSRVPTCAISDRTRKKVNLVSFYSNLTLPKVVYFVCFVCIL